MQYVQEVMTKDVQMVDETTSLTRAARLMKDKDIGFLVVGDSGGAIGVVTDRDIVMNGVARGFDPNQHHVSEVMTGNVLTCDQNAKITEAARRMKEFRVKRLVVTDGEGNLVGVFSLGDLASRTEANPSEISDTLEEIFKTA